MTFNETEGSYAALLGSMLINNNRINRFDTVVKKIINYRSNYEKVEKLTGVPWQVIGVIHYRESDCDFDTHLHNGDSLKRRTVHVPAGYPRTGTPPFTWVESAVDALKLKDWHNITDWSPERTCYELERYNGFGYRNNHPNVLSPYLWAGSNHYQVGKYVSDGKFDPSHVDTQLGVIPLLKRLEYFNDRHNTPISDVIKSSRKLSILRRIRLALTTTFGSIFAADWFNVGVEYLNKIKDFAGDHKLMLILGSACSVWLVFKLIENMHIEDFKNGTYTPSKMVIPAADGETHND